VVARIQATGPAGDTVNEKKTTKLKG